MKFENIAINNGYWFWPAVYTLVTFAILMFFCSYNQLLSSSDVFPPLIVSFVINVLLTGAGIFYLKHKPDKADKVDAQTAHADAELSGLKGLELMKRLLEKLNCEVDMIEKDVMGFSYQGEQFQVRAFDHDNWVRIFDIYWFSCSVESVDEISCMRSAINEGNKAFPISVSYVISEDNTEFNVYSKLDLIINDDIRYRIDYLRMWLGLFFDAKQFVANEFMKQKQSLNVK